MVRARHLSRRTFLGASTAAALSYVYLPGVGRVHAQPHAQAIVTDYQGRLCYNENPLGPAPAALTALQESAELAHRYPDWFNSSLEQQIASYHGLAAQNVCAGAGATEVIRLIADAFLGPGDEVVTATPTYSQMATEAVANGATVVHVPLDENHRIDLPALLAAIGPNTTMVSLVNPNNPVATVFDRIAMEDFLAALPGDIIVVVDEAYHDYVQTATYESCIRYIGEGLPVVVVRTFSKAFGLAGARIGYALASSEHAGLIGSTQQFGMISRPSQAAAVAALSDLPHVVATIDLNQQARTMLETGFSNLGLEYIPSETNFMMFDTGTSAGPVASQLAAMGYQVRTGWGMPQHIRVSTGTLAEMQGFLEALESILVTSVHDAGEIPGELTLNSVHPNPFNARCQIRLAVPGPDPVSLILYDIAGRKIRSLVQGPLPAGVHEVVWDGRNHAGQMVAAGTYILNLVQGEYATSRRISFVK
jgi:histidinol-phosphate aminotransferase